MAKAYDGETIKGVPVSEQMIDQAVERAEQGYDIEVLKRRGRSKVNPNASGESAVIAVRMDEELLGALAAKAERDGLTRSEAIRDHQALGPRRVVMVHEWSRVESGGAGTDHHE